MLAEAQRTTGLTSAHTTVLGHLDGESQEAGIGHAAVVGAIVGYFAVLTIVGAIVFVAGGGPGAALAVGAYVAIWGGPGWGGMIAAQRHADRLADAERSARPPGGDLPTERPARRST